MSAQQFNLVTEWRIEASPERIWAELMAPENWPDWWRAVKRVVALRAGDADGIGAVRRFTWGTALPYSLSFDVTVVRVEPMTVIEGRASGELDGTGRWTLFPAGNASIVRYEWIVDLTKPWMRLFAPVLRPVFSWNHHVVMGWGYNGLNQRLGIGPRS